MKYTKYSESVPEGLFANCDICKLTWEWDLPYVTTPYCRHCRSALFLTSEAWHYPDTEKGRALRDMAIAAGSTAMEDKYRMHRMLPSKLP